MSEITSDFLPPERWHEIADIVREQFQDAMPVTPAQATFPALFDGDQLVAFLHVEHLFHFNSLYVVPQYRDQGLALRMAQEAVRRMPLGESAIWLAPGVRGARFVEQLGARKVGVFTVYRKDV